MATSTGELHYSENPLVQSAIEKDPKLQSILSQLTPGSPEDDVLNSLVTNPAYTGQPFTADDVTNAFNTYNAKLQPGFEQAQAAEKAGIESKLGLTSEQYQNFLSNQKLGYDTDTQNLESAMSGPIGVLNGSARAQKENNLSRQYTLAEQNQKASAANDITQNANTYASDYGSAAGNAPELSQYYNLGNNTYSPGSGSTNDSGSTNVYNPTQYNYGGTQNAARTAAAVTGASGLLANQFNKTLGAFGQANKL